LLRGVLRRSWSAACAGAAQGWGLGVLLLAALCVMRLAAGRWFRLGVLTARWARFKPRCILLCRATRRPHLQAAVGLGAAVCGHATAGVLPAVRLPGALCTLRRQAVGRQGRRRQALGDAFSAQHRAVMLWRQAVDWQRRRCQALDRRKRRRSQALDVGASPLDRCLCSGAQLSAGQHAASQL
jgi:hypothetical protein